MSDASQLATRNYQLPTTNYQLPTMYNWMQAHRKKMLAVFGVLLMIVFVLPSTPGMFQHHASVAGYVGEQEVSREELSVAYQQWEFIARHIAPIIQEMMMTGRAEPWQMALFSDQSLETISRNPELFLLLQREARAMSVQVTDDRVDQFLGLLSTRMPLAGSMQEVNSRRQAMSNLLLIAGAFDRAASAIKVSEPRVRQEIAEQYQTVKLKLVEFRAEDFLSQVPDPTPEQIRKQIDTFGGVDPTNIENEANPLGLSYRLPNRLKFQSLQIPREPVRQLVEKSQTDFQWRSQAFNQYEANKSRYETTEPAKEESTFKDSADLTLAATKPAAPAKRLRPFDEVYPEIKADLLKPLVDQKIKQIQDRVASLLQKGYDRYQAQREGKAAPADSTIKADFITYDFLEQAAQQIQKEYGITPVVQAIANRWLTESDLMALPELGTAMLPGRTFRESVLFADYLINRAAPFRTEEKQKESDTLRLWQPSAALVSPSQDVYFVRIIDAQAAHAPATDAERDEVTAAATADLKTAAAYAKAALAAKAFNDKLTAGQSLTDAAKAANHKVITAGPISRMARRFGAGARVEGYNLSETSRDLFANAAFNLLHDATSDQEHPKAMIDLPRDAKVVVVELDGVDRLPGEDPAQMIARAASIARLTVVVDLAREWFNPDAIRDRLHWKAV